MSQDWENSTLGLEWAKFSERSVHHAHVPPWWAQPPLPSAGFCALSPLSHGADPNQDVLQHRSPKCHLSPGPG